MIIIETCPVCGGDLTHLMLTSNPPIEARHCSVCGRTYYGEQEDVIRVPFTGNVRSFQTVQVACIGCPNHPDNGGSGICNCTLGLHEIAYAIMDKE